MFSTSIGSYKINGIGTVKWMRAYGGTGIVGNLFTCSALLSSTWALYFSPTRLFI